MRSDRRKGRGDIYEASYRSNRSNIPRYSRLGSAAQMIESSVTNVIKVNSTADTFDEYFVEEESTNSVGSTLQ